MTVINLQKSERINLSKLSPGLKSLSVGLGWGKGEFDADASALLVGEDGKAIDYVFYGNPDLKSKCGAITLSGDNRDGEGDGDDETIFINLENVDVKNKIIIAVSLHKAEELGQNFGKVKDAYARLVNNEGDVELARFDLTEDHSLSTGVVFAEIYNKDGEWRAQAVGDGFKDLKELLGKFGLQAA